MSRMSAMSPRKPSPTVIVGSVNTSAAVTNEPLGVPSLLPIVSAHGVGP